MPSQLQVPVEQHAMVTPQVESKTMLPHPGPELLTSAQREPSHSHVSRDESRPCATSFPRRVSDAKTSSCVAGPPEESARLHIVPFQICVMLGAPYWVVTTTISLRESSKPAVKFDP